MIGPIIELGRVYGGKQELGTGSVKSVGHVRHQMEILSRTEFTCLGLRERSWPGK